MADSFKPDSFKAASDSFQTEQAPAPAFAKPQGSAAGRFVEGLWNSVNPGPLIKTFIQAAPAVMSGAPSLEAAQALGDIVQSHIDQFQKAKKSLDEGRHSEAFGHLLAAGLPFVGPAAANAADKMGGEAPQLDKFGNVVKQGQAPDIAGGMGEATGILTGTVAPPYIARGVKAAARAAAPNLVPTIPSSLNPTKQAAVDFLKERGVPLDVGTQTGNRFVKAVQPVTAASPLGSVAASEAAQTTEAGLTRVAGDLAKDVHPNPAKPETAGRGISQSFDKQIEALNLNERGAYGEAWKHVDNPEFTYELPVRAGKPEPVLDAAGKPTGQVAPGKPVMKQVNMPVDVREIKAMLKPIWEEMQFMPSAEQSASAAYKAVKIILEGDDFIPAPAAERGLSGLKTMARAENPNLRNFGQGTAARIVPELQQQVDAAVAHTGDDAFRGLQRGRALHANKMELAAIGDKLRTEPVQTFGQMTWRNDTGIDFLRQINQHAPETLPVVGRAFVDELFNKATQDGGFSRAKTLLNEWRQLGPETKKLLFRDAATRENLDKFFDGAAMIAENPNPSGTAIVSSATSLNPLRWLAGYAGSKLLFSPRGVALLTESMQPKVMASPAATQSVRMQIYRMLGKSAAVGVGKERQQQ
jgi:hypothetical protein